MIIRSSVNCPTVICLTTICYFSREKPLVKPTAPGSYFSYICLGMYFSFAFLYRSIKPKIQKYFATLYFICDLLFQSITNFWHRYPKGIDNPFNTSGCEDLLFVCRGCLFARNYSLAWSAKYYCFRS